MACKPFRSRRHSLWTPPRNNFAARNKKPGMPGFLLPVDWQRYEGCCLAIAALAARSLRTSLGSASNGR
jgi:hypothetical protein